MIRQSHLSGASGGDSKTSDDEFDEASNFSIEAVSQVLCWRDLTADAGGSQDLAADGDALAALACELVKSSVSAGSAS